MDYRIIIKTAASGKKWYYVQRRFAYYFWISGVRSNTYIIGWDTLEEAKQHIQNDVNRRYSIAQQKIVKREVYRGSTRIET